MFHRSRVNLLTARRVTLPRKKHPAVRTAQWAVFIVLAVLGVLALAVLPFWYVSEKVYAHMERGRDEMALAERSVGSLRFDEAIDHIEAAELEFAVAQTRLIQLDPLRGVPYIGPHVVAADRILVSGSAVASALRDMLGIARDVVAVTGEVEGMSGMITGSLPDAATVFKDLSAEQKRKILAAFADGLPQMRQALTKIDAALASFDEIPRDEIAAKFSEPLEPFRARLLDLRDGIEAILPVAEVAPKVLGYPEAKHYLFFFQNNTELRPTGGFLGVYGLARVKDAELQELVTDDIYALDGPAEATQRPVPPAPIRKYIGIDKWYLRDANWAPDFVASSMLMEQFFREEAAVALGSVPPVDGIIAITPQLAVEALKLVGPVTVEGKTFTPENVVDELQFAVEKGFVAEGIPVSERKDIVGVLVKEIVHRLERLPVSELLRAVAIVKRNLEEGHVLIAMKDPALEAIILENDWGGKLKPVRSDYLLVVDANLASLKTDPTVSRTIAYSVTPSKDGLVGSVAITYDHHGRFDWKTTRYRTYTRVYLPKGSELIGVVGAMENDKLKDPARRPGRADAGEEFGRAWFGAFVSIEPGEKRTLEFRFKVAPSVAAAVGRGEYLLDVEKQPGTIAHGLTLDLDLGKKLTNAAPAEDPKEWGDTRYRLRTDLRVDRSFTVGF